MLDARCAAELDFHCQPSAVAKAHDGVHFEAVAVAVVEHVALRCLGVDAQVAYGERFEDLAGVDQLGQHCLAAGAERGGCERRVGHVALGCAAQLCSGLDCRLPGRQVFGDEQSGERSHVVGHGAPVDRTLPGRVACGVVGERGVAGLGGDVAPERAEKPPHVDGVAPGAVDEGDVGSADLFEVAGEDAQSGGAVGLVAHERGPAAAAGGADHVVGARPRVCDAHRLGTEETLERNAAN